MEVGKNDLTLRESLDACIQIFVSIDEAGKDLERKIYLKKKIQRCIDEGEHCQKRIEAYASEKLKLEAQLLELQAEGLL